MLFIRENNCKHYSFVLVSDVLYGSKKEGFWLLHVVVVVVGLRVSVSDTNGVRFIHYY